MLFDSAMGSPLGPTLTNVFKCHFQNIWLENCLPQFKPVVYKRYVGKGYYRKIKYTSIVRKMPKWAI